MMRSERRKMSFWKGHKLYCVLLVVSLSLALGLRLVYEGVSSRMSVNDFQKVFTERYVEAQRELRRLPEVVFARGSGERERLETKASKSHITYCLYRYGRLAYWSDNRMPVSQWEDVDMMSPGVVKIGNYYCFPLTMYRGGNTSVAYITMKTDYPVKSSYLQDHFIDGFNMDASVSFCEGDARDANAVFSPDGRYLFSLDKSTPGRSPSEWMLWLSLAAGCIFLFLILKAINESYRWLLRRERMPLWYFLLVLVVVEMIAWGVFLSGVVYEAVPIDLFSPMYYSTNLGMTSLGQFLFFAGLSFYEVYFFFRHGVIGGDAKYRTLTFIGLHVISIALSAVLVMMIGDVVLNSTMRLDVYQISDISVYGIITILSFFLLSSALLLIRFGLSLYYVRQEKGRSGVKFFVLSNAVVSLLVLLLTLGYEGVYGLLIIYVVSMSIVDASAIYFYKRRAYSTMALDSVPISVILVLISLFSVFVVMVSSSRTDLRRKQLFKDVAQSIESDEFFSRDVASEMFLARLDRKIGKDEYIKALFSKTDSVCPDSMREGNVADYITHAYLRESPSNFLLKAHYYPTDSTGRSSSSSFKRYSNIVAKSIPLVGSRFVYCRGRFSQADYMAYMPLEDGVLFLEFFPKDVLHSYSFPDNFLSEKQNSDYSLHHYSFARYINGMLVMRSGRYRYPEDDGWLRGGVTGGENEFKMKHHSHYVYRASDGSLIVISEFERISSFSLIFFWLTNFIIAIISAVVFLVIKSFVAYLFSKRQRRSWGIVRTQQVVFTSLLFLTVVSIEFIFYFYTSSLYQSRHVAQQESRTRYVQKYLQQAFTETAWWGDSGEFDLAYLLEDVSSTFETDINLYNANGILVASSQPVMRENGLVPQYINPIVFGMGETRTSVITEQLGTMDYFSSYAPIYGRKHQVVGYFNIPSAVSNAIMQREISDLMAVVLGVGLLVTILLYILISTLNSRLTRPLNQLASRLAELNIKSPNKRLQYERQDEIGLLVKQYNVLVARLDDAVEQLSQAERKSAWKLMARQVAHEIKNPLTPIKLNLQMMQNMLANGKTDAFAEYFKQHVPSLIEQIDGLARIATSFSDYAKMPDAVRERVRIFSILKTVKETASRNEFGVQIELVTQADENMMVYADRNQLLQVFNNLVKNAEQSIPQDREGRVVITLAKQGEDAVVNVRDNGCGIAEEIRERIFMPNFTTKNSGMGLGLAIVKTIVETNGGTISYETKEDEGTTFTVHIPCLES